ncbi:MAG: response regulator transcription factor, partial [Candidatus Methylomirabilales bacterium]
TPREREVLERIVLGQTTEDMADEMGVAYNTVRTHIQNVLTKLGVHSKLEAAAFAVRNSLVRFQGARR